MHSQGAALSIALPLLALAVAVALVKRWRGGKRTPMVVEPTAGLRDARGVTGSSSAHPPASTALRAQGCGAEAGSSGVSGTDSVVNTSVNLPRSQRGGHGTTSLPLPAPAPAPAPAPTAGQPQPGMRLEDCIRVKPGLGGGTGGGEGGAGVSGEGSAGTAEAAAGAAAEAAAAAAAAAEYRRPITDLREIPVVPEDAGVAAEAAPGMVEMMNRLYVQEFFVELCQLWSAYVPVTYPLLPPPLPLPSPLPLVSPLSLSLPVVACEFLSPLWYRVLRCAHVHVPPPPLSLPVAACEN